MSEHGHSREDADRRRRATFLLGSPRGLRRHRVDGCPSRRRTRPSGHDVTLIAAGPLGTGGRAFVATFDEPQAGRLGELMPELSYFRGRFQR